MLTPHLKAVLQALLVTFLWSSSWVLIKIGLADIPALTFAGLRYVLAFLILLPLLLRRHEDLRALRALSTQGWLRLGGLGLLLYSLTQGAQFLALSYLPAVTTSLLLSFSPIVVALLGMRLLAERPSAAQWFGVGLYLAGALLYFYPTALPAAQTLGLLVALIGVVSNASAAVLGRAVNREGDVSPLAVTVVSMGLGSVLLLAAGALTQGLPRLNVESWLIVLWLAGVNTALAFTLWNASLKVLSAMESSVINNTMLIQIAVLAWLFLGEGLNAREITALAVAALGVLVVQLWPSLRTLPLGRTFGLARKP